MSERCRIILEGPLAQAYKLLPPRMNSDRATVLLLAIGLQESRLTARRQIRGPARGLWQFEKGGGVRGVLKHPATAMDARVLCKVRDVAPTADAVYPQLEHDDVLAAGFARLNLWWLPDPLPALGDWATAWEQYLDAWRPGKPHAGTWGGLYAEALDTVQTAAA